MNYRSDSNPLLHQLVLLLLSQNKQSNRLPSGIRLLFFHQQYRKQEFKKQLRVMEMLSQTKYFPKMVCTIEQGNSEKKLFIIMQSMGTTIMAQLSKVTVSLQDALIFGKQIAKRLFSF